MSEPTERDRELAQLCTTGICYCDGDKLCAWHRDIAEVCRHSRGEEREWWEGGLPHLGYWDMACLDLFFSMLLPGAARWIHPTEVIVRKW